MGNSSSTDDEEDRETEVERQPDVIAPIRPPAEDRVDPDIIENLDQPLDNDRFVLGIESVSSLDQCFSNTFRHDARKLF